jgi:EAL domain-containing protein (putative c-di-GMP-specific phosphodiesterase class I)
MAASADGTDPSGPFHSHRREQRPDCSDRNVGVKDRLRASAPLATGRAAGHQDGGKRVGRAITAGGFCERVREILADTGLSAENLELEITESLVLTNEELMLSILRDLRRMGVALSIDDFGTGYSSFSYLKHFRASKFKIDRSLIRDIAVNADDAAITAAIIQMAKTLRLTVIAEGVEDAAQMDFLRAHQCDQIQGYHFSKPLPPEEVAQKLRALITPATRAATAG